MRITFTWNDQSWQADLAQPLDISIPLINGADNQPNAYGAPPYEASPVISGDFIGSLEAGSPVNFFNVAINPHGNGTHTECVGHILAGPYRIHECLQRSHFLAEVISVTPQEVPGGMAITHNQIRNAVSFRTDALVVRTLPNSEAKKTRQYTGSNPPWFDEDALLWIREQGYQHLLTDLPSVDPEVDGGSLVGHKAFWDTSGEVRRNATITEMIYVPSEIPDGLYLLDLHNLAFDLDVSPSRPMLYVVDKA